ncbi:hypothetical protein ATG_15670 [Desulfurococcaceae archaeon AG1]|nr:hypothetical protein ATG_15670 [Desulfurococcaceae archaeon AG1]
MGWGHPERVGAKDKGSDERSPEVEEAKGRAVDAKTNRNEARTPAWASYYPS